MSGKAQLQKVSEETMRFMRGKYKLDEVAGMYYDIACLKFRQGKRTLLSINIHENRFDFQIIFGKTEREIFEARRNEFSQKIQDIYDNSTTYHDGKWMLFPVADLETLEAIKPLIIIKKKPNRKPFPKEQAVYSDCGYRCDLCVHYKGKTTWGTEEMEYARECCTALYGISDWEMNCDGCHFPDCISDSAVCRKEKGAEKCHGCANFTRCLKTAGWPPEIHTRNITADQVTYAILPYLKGQYGN